MKKRLAVIALGHSNSGKSTTWNKLFQATVRTGPKARKFYLNAAQYVDDAFVVGGSPEERIKTISAIVPKTFPTLVFCPIQYVAGANRTFDFFLKNDYDILVVWLNPGAKDPKAYPDSLGMISHLLSKGAAVQQRSAKKKNAPDERAREIRQFVLGWATHRNLVTTEFP